MRSVIQTGFIAGLLLVCANAVAQTKTAHTYFDLMVNVVSSNLNYGSSNTAFSDYKKANNGLQAGATFQAGITSHLSLVTELYFIRKGGKLKEGNPLTTQASALRLNTFELPVLARIHLRNFYVNAGPSIAHNVSGKSSLDEVSTKLCFGNAGAGFKRFDAGIQFGAGVEFPFKQRRIALDVRYAYGLTNISYDKEIYNRAIMISVHFSKAWKRNPLGCH